MSLSTLSGQLSKLNEKRNNKEGLSVKGSKRHDEAAGRGINYSTQYNQTVVLSNKSEKYKASFFAKTSKSGSDVSVLELLDNCRLSLMKLNESYDGSFERFYLGDGSVCGLKSHERERGLLGKDENVEVDKDIYLLLVLLSLVIQEDAFNCFHVLEYLLRRYDIHVNETSSDALLLMFSMHHYKPFYFRLMELIDLASIGSNTWLFLRPYVIPGSDPPPANVFSKKCSVDDSMLGKNLKFMKDIASHAGSNNSIDKNVEEILSFHAKIVHEALKMQYESKGRLQELSLRKVLSFILEFMSGDNMRLIKCSHVLMIQFLQYTNDTLQDKILHLLMDTTLKAAVKKEHDSLLPEAMMVIVALIKPTSPTDPSSLYRVRPFSQVTYKLFSSHYKTLLPCLGYLWEDKGIRVVNIIVSILSSAINQLEDKTALEIIRYIMQLKSLSTIWETSHTLMNNKNKNKSIHTLLSSIEAMDNNVSTICVYMLLTSYTHKKEQASKVPVAITQNYQKCFTLFQDKSPTGVSTALIQFILEYITTSTSSNTIHELALTELIPQTKSLLVQKQSSSDKNMMIMKQISNLLSPTVLMKHTNPFVRKQNIDKFIIQKSQTREEPNSKAEIKDKKSTLLQIFLNDLNVNVAVHAFKSFCNIDKMKNSTIENDDGVSVHGNQDMISLEIALKGINKWGLFSNLNNDTTLSAERIKACLYALELSKIALQQKQLNPIVNADINDNVLSSLIQALFAHSYIHINGSNLLKIHTTSKNILLTLLKANNKGEAHEFSLLLVSNPTGRSIIYHCIQQLRKNNGLDDDQVQQSFHEIYTIMSFLKASFDIYSSTEKQKIEGLLVPDVKLLMIQSTMSMISYMDDAINLRDKQKVPISFFTDDDFALVLKVWEHIFFSKIDYISINETTIGEISLKLTSLSRNDMYDNFGKDAFSIICNSVSSSKYEKLSAILQVCCSSLSYTSKKRILEMTEVDILPAIASTSENNKKDDTKEWVVSSIILSCLALLTNKDDAYIRKIGLEILFTISRNNNLQKNKGDPLLNQLYQLLLSSCCSSSNDSSSSTTITNAQKFSKSTQFLIGYSGGIELLVNILNSLSSKNNTSKTTNNMRILLLQRCLDYAINANEITTNLFGSDHNGTYSTITILLSAMQQSSSFTCSECWEYFGKQVFSKYCITSKMDNQKQAYKLESKDHHQSPLASTLEYIVRMLLNIDNDTPMKYNKDMAKAIQHCLYLKAFSSVSSIDSTYVSYIYSKLLNIIFTNSSWLHDTFSNYDKELKSSVSMLLLLISSFDNSADDEDDVVLLLSRQAWMNIPLDIHDYTDIIDSWRNIQDTLVYTVPSSIGTICLKNLNDENNAFTVSSFLGAFTFILDSIRSRLNVFFNDTDQVTSTSFVTSLWELLCQLFDQLNLLCIDSTTSTMKKEGLVANQSYVTLYLLQTLKDIYNMIDSNESVKKSLATKIKNEKGQTKFQYFVDLLVGIIGGINTENNKGRYKTLHSDKAKISAISLLTCLCLQCPSIVSHPLIMTMLGILPSHDQRDHIGNDGTKLKMNSSLIKDSFELIVQSYCKQTETICDSHHSSISDLVAAFVWHCYTSGLCSDNAEFMSVCGWFIQALLKGERSSLIEKENRNTVGVSVASYIAFLTALEARKIYNEDSCSMGTSANGKEAQSNTFISFIFEILKELNDDPSILIVLYQELLTYTESLFSMVLDNVLSIPNDKSNTKYSLDVQDLLIFAFHENPADFYHLSKVVDQKKELSYDEEKDYTTLMWITTNLLYIVKEGLSDSTMEEYIQYYTPSSVDSSSIFVNMSRQFIRMSVYANSNSIMTTKENVVKNHIMSNFLNAIGSSTKDCADFFNYSLPFSHFISCITSLIGDTGDDIAMKKCALQMLSEKIADIEAGSSEALDLLSLVYTDLAPLIDIDSFYTLKNDVTKQRQLVVFQQGLFIAIERIVYFTFRPGVYSRKDEMKIGEEKLLPLLKDIVSMIEKLVSTLLANFQNFLKKKDETAKVVNTLTTQLLSSALLSTTTFIHAMKMKCLPILPKLVPSLTSCLVAVNECHEKFSNDKAPTSKEQDCFSFTTNLNLMQQSILRSLSSIVETLPQFMREYLEEIFQPSCILSNELRSNGLNNVDQIDNLLGTLVPIRFLIPAACVAITDNCGIRPQRKSNTNGTVKWREAGAVFSILKVSIDKANRDDITPFISRIFDICLTAFDLRYISVLQERRKFASSINGTFMALVMKLSEAQLQSIYARFREWRGEMDVQNSSSYVKRYSFWNMSARLSKELRGIFLSCLTTVFNDAVEELNYYASTLTREGVKSASSNSDEREEFNEGRQRKKLKVDKQQTTEHDMEVFTTLQPILLCLQYALTADADNGGSWIQADDGARYHLVLKPIAKLFFSVIPKNLYIAVDNEIEEGKTSQYQSIIEGVNTIETGSVIGCITALAAAAGNEQMWKPLNRSIVDVCGHERSEVRKAGLTALFSILKKVGEEYTPLLPECMPVISELLEDEVEDISNLAQEIQRVGEELLGESFEDSFY